MLLTYLKKYSVLTACYSIKQVLADIKQSICQLLASFCNTSKTLTFAYV